MRQEPVPLIFCARGCSVLCCCELYVAHQHMASRDDTAVHESAYAPISPSPDFSCREARGLLRTGPAL